MSLADRIAVLNAGRVEQVDAPVTLYERPATPFVAGFVGANNLFTGTACAGGLSCEGLGVLAGPDGLEEGASALLAVRPERVVLGLAETEVFEESRAERDSAGDDADDAESLEAQDGSGDAVEAVQDTLEGAEVVAEGQGAAPEANAPDVSNAPSGAIEGAEALRGRVADVSFYGGVSHVSVLVPGRDGVVLVATQGATRVQVGSSVTLTWASEDGVLIPQ